jgi:uncharacterized repeat protein (TIGR03803 family)
LYGTLSAQATTVYGQVFELSPAAGGTRNYSVLQTFTDVADGGQPYGEVILDAAGNLYGTPSEGGGNGFGSTSGAGVVFELSSGAKGWQESVLYDFLSGGQTQPQSGLVMDASGNLYGTTSEGGAHAWGTIYEMSAVAGEWEGKTL